MKRAAWLAFFLFAACRPAPLPPLSPDAPADQPWSVGESDELRALDEELQPLVLEARKTYPSARQRFLRGLEPGYAFYVVVRLHDAEGRAEQVFLAVDRIVNGQIHGRIANELQIVSGYESGSAYTVAETQILDWLITNPDGSEEGNYIGKYLDGRKD